MMIDFKDVHLKGKKKCMCEVFKKEQRMYVVMGGMLWNGARWERHRKFKGNEKSSRENKWHCLTSERAT